MTLGELLTKWRGILRDTETPLLWTDRDLTLYANDTIDELTEELFLIEDTGVGVTVSVTFNSIARTIIREAGSFISDGFKVGMPIWTTSATNPGPFTIEDLTAQALTVKETVVTAIPTTISIYDAICHISVLADGTVLYPIDDRIIRIARAKLLAQTMPMQILGGNTVAIMDATYPGWESTTTRGTPFILLTHGVGMGKVRIYPPARAVDILKLTVFRNQLNPLDVSFPDESPEIPEKFHKYLDSGVFKRCYSKDDVETLKPNLAEKYRILFEKDKDDIKRKGLKRDYTKMTATPPMGAL